jgi:hypothetical protein
VPKERRRRVAEKESLAAVLTSATSTKNLVGSSVRTPCLLWYLRSGVAPAAAVLSVLSAPSRSFAPPRPRPVAPLLPPCGSAATLPPRSLCCSAPSYRFRPPAPPPSQPSPPSAICVGATACGAVQHDEAQPAEDHDERVGELRDELARARVVERTEHPLRACTRAMRALGRGRGWGRGAGGWDLGAWGLGQGRGRDGLACMMSAMAAE